MGRFKDKAMFVEAKVLEKLQEGSFEEILSLLDRAVAESDGMFGGDAVLFSTYPGSVIVLSEDGSFYSVNYVLNDGVVKFRNARKIDVAVLSEDDIVSRGVDSFSDKGTLAESLRSMMSLRNMGASSPLGQVSEDLGRLFSRGRLWKKVVHEHRQRIGQFAWDADYGKLEVSIRPLFAQFLENGDVDEDEDIRGDVLESLSVLEGKIGEMLSRVQDSYESLVTGNVQMRSEEDDSVRSQFESFASDYIDHMGDVMETVSGAISEMRDTGCVLCGAKVYDEVARRYRDFDLGGRFVRKVSEAFIQ
jgi:hypothetical protein